MYVGVCVKKSDVTPFVIINIFISNCNLITIFFLVTVTDNNYFYFVIQLCNSRNPRRKAQRVGAQPLNI